MTAKDFDDWIGKHIFTPTEFQNYLGCPFRVYAESFLQLRPPAEREIEMTPAEEGDCLHRILANPPRAAEILDEFRNRPGLSLPLFERRKAHILKVLEDFLTVEKTRRSPLQTAYREWSFGSRNIPPLEIGDGQQKIKIRGRVDRIDVDHRLRRFLIIDYKTGSQTISGASIERGEALQLPLYILAVQELLLPGYEPIGGLYYKLSDMSLKEGILQTDRIPDGIEIGPRSSTFIPPARWEPLFEKSKEKVREIVAAIRRGDFPCRPDKCYSSCPYREICWVSV